MLRLDEIPLDGLSKLYGLIPFIGVFEFLDDSPIFFFFPLFLNRLWLRAENGFISDSAFDAVLPELAKALVEGLVDVFPPPFAELAYADWDR